MAVVYYRVRGNECTIVCMDLLKEVAIIFITSTIVWSQVNNREETAPPITRKLDILNSNLFYT